MEKVRVTNAREQCVALGKACGTSELYGDIILMV